MVVLGSSSAVWATVAAPVFSPGGDDSPVAFPVTVTCATSGATIHYTLNGSEPTTSDPTVASGATVDIKRKVTLKAKAWSGTEISATTTTEYNLTGDVAAGSHHVLSLSSNGAIKAWGSQASGRLGNGLTAIADVTAPTASKYDASTPITNAIAIGAGQNHSLFIKPESGAGGVWNSVCSFGNNASGELGNDTLTNQAYAVHVLKSSSSTDYLANCLMVRAGENFSGALGSDHKVYMWGSQGGGRLGNGATLGNKKTAVNVLTGPSGASALTNIVGISLGSGFALAREPYTPGTSGSSGYVWSWGQGASGRLGQGSIGNKDYAYKVKMNSTTDLTDACDVGAGGSHGVVVRRNTTGENGSVWTFGDGTSGRLGNNSTSDQLYPVQVKRMNDAGTGLVNLDQISMIAAGSAHTLALDESGKVWAWGYNGYGALGNNSTVDKAYAVWVKNPSGNGQLGDAEEGKIVWISAGGDGSNNTSYAISEKGVIYAWGRNDNGEMGNGGNTGYVTKPAAVPGLKVVPGYPDVGLVHTVNQGLDPGNVTLTASPSDPDGISTISKVEFWSQGVKAGEVASPPYQYVLSGLPANSYSVYAVVFDADGNKGYSSPVNFTIDPSNPLSDDDGDGLTYADEGVIGTLPKNPDSDYDGMGDGYEKYYNLAPLSPASSTGNNLGPNDDKDGDGLTNKDEADRGRIPTSATEAPAITGTFPTSYAKWWGVKNIDYYFEYSSDNINWTRYSTLLAGGNAEIALQISTVVGSQPPYTRIVTVSHAPEVLLSYSITDSVALGAVTLTANPSDPDGPSDIDKVDFYLDGVLSGTDAAGPTWAVSLDSLGAGSHEAYAIVTDHSTKRGFSSKVTFSIDAPPPEADEDFDGMPDQWEMLHFGSLNETSGGDRDGDLVTNAAEYSAGTKPNDIDSDGDGIPDNLDGNPLVALKQDFTASSLLVISPVQ
jgi:alpha-tubulin suppressor-like RCC1 family protein